MQTNNNNLIKFRDNEISQKLNKSRNSPGITAKNCLHQFFFLIAEILQSINLTSEEISEIATYIKIEQSDFKDTSHFLIVARSLLKESAISEQLSEKIDRLTNCELIAVLNSKYNEVE